MAVRQVGTYFQNRQLEEMFLQATFKIATCLSASSVELLQHFPLLS
jgi:hypothetical protein